MSQTDKKPHQITLDELLEQRSLEMLSRNESQGEKIVKEMNRMYKIAQESILKEMKYIFDRYSKGNDITPEKTAEYITKAEYLEWRMTIKEYMQAIEAFGKESAIGKALWLELETLSANKRITRLDYLRSIIDANMAKIAVVEERKIYDHLETVFKDDFYENMYMFYGIGEERVLELMEKNAIAVTNTFVQDVILASWAGNNFVERIWRNEYNNAFKLTDLIARSLVAGESNAKIAKELSEQFGFNKESLRMLILTETAHVKVEADIHSYEESGIDSVTFKATADEKTCHKCVPRDRQVIKIEDLKDGVNKPPLHPRCRCSLLPHSNQLQKYLDKFGTRAIRDENGKTVYAPIMSVEEWRKKYVK